MFKNSQRGVAHILLIISALGIITFLVISSAASFKDKLFSNLFPKDFSFASTQFNGKNVSFLKFFGEKSITETARNKVTANHLYHSSGVVVDKSSTPNKVYVVDSGNNRILGFNGAGVCTSSPSTSCTVNSDCGAGDTCRVDGTKPADIVFGQDDFESASCNRDNNNGLTLDPSAKTLCLTGHPVPTNIAEMWMRSNIDVDSQGNLYVPDRWNNRVLKYNSPFSADITDGKGNNEADFVLGQKDLNTNGINGAPYFGPLSPPTDQSLYFSFGPPDHVSSRGVSVDNSGNVWVADTFNNRVLRFPPGSQKADLVLGQPNFTTTGCSQNGLLNKMCTPTLARVDPQSGDLYIVDEFPGGFKARILVFKPTFTNGMSADHILKVDPQNSTFNLTLATGFVFNPYTEGEYSAGKLWLSNGGRIILLDAQGEIVKVVGRKTKTSNGGYAEYENCANVDDPNSFHVWDPGGGIGFDQDNNIYLADEMYHRVARFSLPYNTYVNGTGHTCLPNPNGGLFKSDPGQSSRRPNLITDDSLGESVGLGIFQGTNFNQLAVSDETSLKVWNNYLEKSEGASPDIVIKGKGGRQFISAALDDLNRVWSYDEHGAVVIHQLPYMGNDLNIGWHPRLYWADTNEEINPPISPGTGIAFDKINKAIYLSDQSGNRVLRIKNYQNPGQPLLVDRVLGQSNKTERRCNRGSYEINGENYPGTPAANTFCEPYALNFDKLGNLYVVENRYECHGNDRITVYLADDLKNASGMFPNLEAKKVFIASDLNSTGQCAYNVVNKPASPVSIAFDSQNHLVIGNDGYYGDESIRAYRQLWYYENPLEKQTPDAYIDLPMGAPGEIAFDKDDNLIIQDHTWNRVFAINYYIDNTWLNYLVPRITPTVTPTRTPTPTTKPTPTKTPTPIESGPTKTPTPTPKPVNNYKPQGNVVYPNSPSAYCSTITGWSCDKDKKNKAIQVDFWDYTSTPKYLGAVSANLDLYNSSSLQTNCGHPGVKINHGFKFTIPKALKDNKTHKIRAYAVNINSYGLNITPKSFTQLKSIPTNSNNEVLVKCSP